MSKIEKKHKNKTLRISNLIVTHEYTPPSPEPTLTLIDAEGGVVGPLANLDCGNTPHHLPVEHAGGAAMAR
jgi:hypothetical protein